jgi:hypothetical protein
MCSLLPAQAYQGAADMGGSEDVMPNRANSLAFAAPVLTAPAASAFTSRAFTIRAFTARVFVAGTLAAAASPCLNTASSAGDCLEAPDSRVTQPGHWYYRSDRTLNRRCWYFEPAEAPAAAAPSVAAVPSVAAAPATASDDQSLLSRFAASFSQGFSPQQPQQATVPDSAGEAVQTVSPKPAKPARTVQRERSQIVPAPTTNGAATAEHQASPSQPVASKDERREPPLDVAEREALFQDFMKWQLERNVFGRP